MQQADFERSGVNKAERASKYWICKDCASKKGWHLPDHNITVIIGLCGHCSRKDEVTLTPQCDFVGPGKRYNGD